MIGRLFRTLAGWCWAMYLVALIVWVVALVASFDVELHGAFSWDNPNSCELKDGSIEADLRGMLYLKPTDAEFSNSEIALPGIKFISHGDVFRHAGGTGVWRYHELHLDGWLTTIVLLTPVLMATVIHVWRSRGHRAQSRNRLQEACGLLQRMVVGAAIWTIVGLIALLLLTRDQSEPAFALAVGTPAQEVAGFGTVVRDRQLVVGASALDQVSPGLARFWNGGTQFPPGTSEATCPLWVVFAGLALGPALSLIVNLRCAPIPPGCCKACGYDLRGSPASDAKCPECGWSASRK